MDRRTEFQRSYQEGRKVMNRSNDEAKKWFEKAKAEFKIGRDQPYRFFDLMIDLSRIEKKKRQFKKATDILDECQQKMKEMQRKGGQKLELQQRWQFCIKLKTEQCQVLCSQIQTLKDKGAVLDKCIQKFSFCLNDISRRLLELYREEEKDIYAIQKCEQLYSEIIISSIDPIILDSDYEVHNFPFYPKLIYKIANKMQDFFRHAIYSKESHILQRQLANSWYYKGSCLVKYSNKQEAIQLLQKQFMYCDKIKDEESKEKTRGQLIKYYIKKCELKKVKELLGNNRDKLATFNSNQVSDLTQVENLEREITSQHFSTLEPKHQFDTIQRLVSILENEQNNWMGRFLKLVNRLDLSKFEGEAAFELYYQMATAFLYDFSYCQAIDAIKKSFRFCQVGSENYYESYILLMKIFLHNNNLVEARQVYRQYLEKSEHKQIAAEILNQFDKIKERQREYESRLVMTEAEKILFKFLEDKKKGDPSIPEMVEESKERRPSLFNMRKQSMTSKQVLRKTYEDLCHSSRIPLRKYILQKIQRIGDYQKYVDIDLGLFYDLNQSELQILLDIVRSRSWNLKNFSIKDSFLKKFIQKIDPSEIVRLTLNCKTISQQVLNILMVKLRQISHLELENYKKRQRFQFNFIALSPSLSESLKTLKISNSDITDEDIVHICSSYQSLTELSLSHNQINGRQFEHICKLTQLKKLDISNNPISTSLSSIDNVAMEQLVIQGVLGENQALQIRQIKYLRSLDFSKNSSGMVEKMVRNFVNYCKNQELIKLPKLCEIYLLKCKLNKEVFLQLYDILRLSQNFKLLDLRFCGYEQDSFEEFCKLLEQQNIIIEIKRGGLSVRRL